MATAEIAREIGVLTNNGITVRSLYQSLRSAANLHEIIPGTVKVMLRVNAWRHFMTMDGKEFEWQPHEFRRFLEAPAPSGCGTTVAMMLKFLEGTEVLAPFNELVRGERGGDKNPYGRSGKPQEEINRDDVTVDLLGPDDEPEPAPTIVLDPEVPRPKPKRDHKQEAATGNSTSYALRRLSRQSPDLYQRVLDGEISPNAAMVEAGFRARTLTVPFDPVRAVGILTRNFRPDDLKALAYGLCQAAGITVDPPTIDAGS